MKQYKIFNYNVIFKKEPEGGYTVQVPSLPGCVTYGETLEEAKKMALDAIKVYIASLKKHGESIPNDEAVFIATLSVNFPRAVKRAHA